MNLTVLVDNNTHLGNCLISEHGLSFLVEELDTKLIFDCGTTDAYIKNAYKMDLDLENVTDIVLSHSHLDHIGGFLRLQSLYKKFKFIGINFNQKNVISHPDVFKLVDKSENAAEVAEEELHLAKDKLEEFFNLKLCTEPMNITQKLVYLGEIPVKSEHKSDYTPDEVALVYKSNDGLVIMSGCSHCGVQNIIEYAKKVTGESRVETLIGGMYLINRSVDEINELGKYLQQQNIKHIYPCHCTDLESKIILSRYVKIEEVSTGKKYSWN